MSGYIANTGYKFPIQNYDGTVTLTSPYSPSASANTNGPGALWTCGYNGYGSLGDGTTTNKSSPVQVGSLITWSQVSGSRFNSFGIKSDGTLWAWGGYNGAGSLGNGTTIDYVSPIQIGSLTNWSQVAGGYQTTAAVKTDGTLWVWGQNNNGQLGNGTITSYSSPIQVGSLTNWKQVSVGDVNIIAAIKTDGTLWTCGYNNMGQLGNGTITSYSSPIQVGSLTNWKQVACGNYYTIAAVKTDGTLWVWGYGFAGGFGNGVGATIKYSSPIQIGSLTNWSSVSYGDSNGIALKTDGTLWTWGYNATGQLGDGTTISKSSPVQIGALTTWNKVSCGYGHTLATKTDGTLWAWGRNDKGQLNNGTTVYYSSPIQVGSLTNWNFVTGAYRSTMAIANNNIVQQVPANLVDLADIMVKKDSWYNSGLWGWGYNSEGELGNETTIRYSSPIQIGALTNWKQISVGRFSSSAIKTDGTLWGWGYNQDGELGNGNTTRYSSPVQIGSLSYWKQVACGYNTSAIETDGSLWAWGTNNNGELGNGTTIKYSSPIQIGSLTNWKQVTTDKGHTAAVKTDGTLWTWGRNNYGQLGYNYGSVFTSTLNFSKPTIVGSGRQSDWLTTDINTDVVIDVYGSGHSVAIKADGTLWAWGYNGDGQLGNGTTIDYSSPIQIGSLTNWKQVASGGYHTAAIKTDGTLWTWGDNSIDNTDYSSPIQVGLLTNWKHVSAGFSTTIAIKTDGTLWMWGANLSGQLGNGTRTTYYSPIQVGLLTNWKQVAGGDDHTAAIKTDGTLWAWGSNDAGHLGNGTTIAYSSPIQVGSLTNWKQVSCGRDYVAAIKTDGTLWAWGLGQDGALGNGTTTNYSSPIQIGSLTNWKRVVCAPSNAAAVKTDGTLWTWGYNLYGQLGNETTTKYSSPIQVGSSTNWTQIASGDLHVYAHNSDGDLYAWGLNERGQTGVAENLLGNNLSPIQVGSLTNWKQVSVAGDTPYTMAIKTDGTLWTWGSNRYGNLGNGTTVYYSSPIQIGSLTNWKQVSAGIYHTAAIKTDGTLWAWGSNQAGVSSTGALGNGVNSGYYSSPIQIGSLTDWKQVKAGDSSTFAVKTDGTLWAWGTNEDGRLGNGTTSYYSSPIQVGSLTIWKEVSGQLACSAIQAPDYELPRYVPGPPTGLSI